MRIVVDMDEVIFNFVDPILEWWNYEHGTSFIRQEFNMWDMSKTLGPGAYQEVEAYINSRPSFFEDLKPLPGAVEGFNKLLDSQNEIIVGTAVSPTVYFAYDSKRGSMAKHFPKFDLKNLVVLSPKHIIDAPLLIDDAEHNILSWVGHGKRVIIVDKPWNQGVEDYYVPFSQSRGMMHRVTNWSQINAIVEHMENTYD